MDREAITKEIDLCQYRISREKSRIRELEQSLAEFDGWPRIATGSGEWGKDRYLVLGYLERRNMRRYVVRRIRKDGTLGPNSTGWVMLIDREEPNFLTDEEAASLAEKFPKRRWAKHFRRQNGYRQKDWQDG